MRDPPSAFLARLRDLLSTIEAGALLGGFDSRMRGLREQLHFACVALPCDEALVAIEREAFGRLTIPLVATAAAARDPGVDFLPTGTPFAHLFAGGEAHALSLAAGDAAIAPFRAALSSDYAAAVFAPVRLGASVVGGVALFAHAPMGDRELSLGEQLGQVLSLTVEALRSERALLEIFAAALPDVLSEGSGTRLRESLESALVALRADAGYRRKLKVAFAGARIAARGEAETELAGDLLERLDRYFGSLERREDGLG